MTRLDQMRKLALTTWLFVLLAPLAVAAQNATPTSNQNTQGPMIVERVKSAFLVAPDFKVTEVDHKTSELAGAYARTVASIVSRNWRTGFCPRRSCGAGCWRESRRWCPGSHCR